MLGQTANYCPNISCNTLITKKHLTSYSFILWVSNYHFIDFVNIQKEADKKHEDLYQHLIAFTEDSFRKDSVLANRGEAITED